MRIAQIAPIIERVPPTTYGGIERSVYYITEELVKRGHDVTLFASGDSVTSAKLSAVVPTALKEMKHSDPYGPNALTALHYGFAYSMQNDFDVIHDHMNNISLAAANLSTTPVITNMHGPFTPELRQLYSTLTNPYVVTISKKQYEMGPKNLNHVGTVYHGIPVEEFPFSSTHDGYLLFVGRITMEKGVHLAIAAAKQLGIPLIIAAKLEKTFKPDLDYYEKYVKPELNDKIQWIGPVDIKTRNNLMKKALAFLHPTNWPEPFGLTLIEAMACGAPVIACNQGSIPEIIADQKTGFVVHSLDEMIQGIKKVESINRQECRKHVETNFNTQKMVDSYEKIYQGVLSRKKIMFPQKKIFSFHAVSTNGVSKNNQPSLFIEKKEYYSS